VRERFDRLEEQLEIITGLWGTPAGSTYDFSGTHYQVTDSPALPKPAQAKPPVIIGGTGARRTPRLAARFADEFNVPFHTPEDTGATFDRVRAAAAETGRTLIYSAAQTVVVGRTEAEVKRRADAIGNDPDRLRVEGLAGSPAELVDKIGRFAELGAERIYLQILDLSDLDQIELLAAEVLPQV
jgi:alkanesulfonate monooxygenase SsuD/methylene tetrahydromethanopterin reductase-like flavin-dependent oxidoreductase (luciferase family)